jgi:PE-PPE domain-containing protein
MSTNLFDGADGGFFAVKNDEEQHSKWPTLVAGVVVVGASLIAVPSVAAPLPHVQVHEIQLVNVDTAESPLGDGTALVYGGSGIPIPPPQYMDAADTLYLQPNGFTGTAQSAFTPEGAYPITGVHSLELGTSLGQDQQIMVSDIEGQISAGGVNPENPVVVFGWSQSAYASSLIMPQLQAAGVPGDDVHFVLVGDPQIPNGGFDNTFDFPAGNTAALTAFDFPLLPPAPTDLYPTDIYTFEYDGFADVPHYTTNLLSDLNALVGFFLSDVTLSSPPADIVNDISATLSADYSSLLPIADAINVLLTSLPAYDANIITDQLDAGNFLGAILDPMSANTALVPYDLLLGLPPAVFAAIGTAVNVAELFS